MIKNSIWKYPVLSLLYLSTKIEVDFIKSRLFIKYYPPYRLPCTPWDKFNGFLSIISSLQCFSYSNK